MTERQIFALGFFDGIHLGHAALLRAACELAEQRDAAAAVMTFDRHPDALVTGTEVPLINSASDRALLIRNLSGIERILLLPFDQETMRMPWRSFLDTLTEREHAAGFVVGHDFRFGWRGEGSADKLRIYCRERDLLCRIIPPVRLDGLTVSSTLIRRQLLDGHMAEAVRFLGHPHLLSGQAENGALFPGSGVLLPAPGLYAARLTSRAGRGDELALRVERDRVLLPEADLRGSIRLDFTRRLTDEEMK